MAVFKGKAGADALMREVDARCKMLMIHASVDTTHRLIDESPVGVELYPTKNGEPVQNIPGDFKNSWSVGIGSVNREVRPPDPQGAGAFVDAIKDSLRYNFEDELFITNGVDYASQVENGWNEYEDPSRGFRGWEDRDGYHVVENLSAEAQQILKKALMKAKKAKASEL